MSRLTPAPAGLRSDYTHATGVQIGVSVGGTVLFRFITVSGIVTIGIDRSQFESLLADAPEVLQRAAEASTRTKKEIRFDGWCHALLRGQLAQSLRRVAAMSLSRPGDRTRVRLEGRDRSLVHLSDMPPFQNLPEVIVWGDRVFKLYLETQEPVIYQEVFSYVLP